MSKFYSTRSNAVRAARSANIADFQISEVDHPTVAGAKQYAWVTAGAELESAPVVEQETTVEMPVETAPAPTAQKKPRNGAVAKAWDIFASNPGIARKDAIQMAVDAGVNYYTARTQFQQYFKVVNG